MRVVSLTSDEPHHFFLVSQLSTNFQLVGAIIESGIEQRKRLNKSQLWSSFFWFTYHYIRRKIFGLEAFRKSYFYRYTNWDALKNVNFSKTEWINSDSVQSLLRAWKPDVVIVCGTSIIKPKVLHLCGTTVINIHGGYLPYYRGNHCIFFALYEQEYDKIGATIHFVNEGIDTGDIIEVIKPKIFQSDNAEKIYCRADHLAMIRLIELLHAYHQGTTLPRVKQPSVGRTFKMRDRSPLHDIFYFLKRNLRLIIIPKLLKNHSSSNILDK